jgi:hypothetical protein
MAHQRAKRFTGRHAVNATMEEFALQIHIFGQLFTWYVDIGRPPCSCGPSGCCSDLPDALVRLDHGLWLLPDHDLCNRQPAPPTLDGGNVAVAESQLKPTDWNES